MPGGREGAVAWGVGYPVVFGGYGIDSVGTVGYLNDLWLFNPEVRQWYWMSGSNKTGASGVYGTKGTSNWGNVPGAREGAGSWTESVGHLWLFGGYGRDSTGSEGMLNDLWRVDLPDSWTWVSGASTANAAGVYGTQGIASASNIPGARQASVTWTDAAGNLWLFGGYGIDSMGNTGELNDLWHFSPTTGQWTWINGANTRWEPTVYGVKNVQAPSNMPGARLGAVSWTDSSGNLWLFGGRGITSQGATAYQGHVNDLWRFSISTGQWTWVSGSNVAEATSVYGTKGIASPSNVPGARGFSVTWIDSAGGLWLFGGYEIISGLITYRGDLWRFEPVTGQWTWVGGSVDNFADAVYGVQGVAAVDNMPGARFNAVSWRDPTGALWLFGGNRLSSGWPYMNDMWKYTP